MSSATLDHYSLYFSLFHLRLSRKVYSLFLYPSLENNRLRWRYNFAAGRLPRGLRATLPTWVEAPSVDHAITICDSSVVFACWDKFDLALFEKATITVICADGPELISVSQVIRTTSVDTVLTAATWVDITAGGYGKTEVFSTGNLNDSAGRL